MDLVARIAVLAGALVAFGLVTDFAGVGAQLGELVGDAVDFASVGGGGDEEGWEEGGGSHFDCCG